MVTIKKHIIKIILAFIVLIILISIRPHPKLIGFYQSDIVNGHHVQLSIWNRDGTFTMYIDNRGVLMGRYEEKDDSKYELIGENRSYAIELDRKNSFVITINKLNDGEPFVMENISFTPTHFPPDFGDEDMYREWLN